MAQPVSSAYRRTERRLEEAKQSSLMGTVLLMPPDTRLRPTSIGTR